MYYVPPRQVWVADATQLSPREFLLTNKDYNSVEHVGDKLCITFIGHPDGDVNPVTQFYIEGMGARELTQSQSVITLLSLNLSYISLRRDAFL